MRLAMRISAIAFAGGMLGALCYGQSMFRGDAAHSGIYRVPVHDNSME